MMGLHLTAWVTLASLVVYIWMAYKVVEARVKHNVPAPAMDGPLAFQSAMRVQVNTLEQIAIFLPALWLCAVYLGDSWAAAGGLLWIVGRIVYALGYYQAPSKREIGFGMTFFASVALMIGAAVGLFLH